jgi:Zn-dependent oligopeptidase
MCLVYVAGHRGSCPSSVHCTVSHCAVVSAVLCCAVLCRAVLRCQVYMAGAQGPAENLSMLDHMLAARHQLGTLLGFRSYAAFKAADGTLAGEVVWGLEQHIALMNK